MLHFYSNTCASFARSTLGLFPPPLEGLGGGPTGSDLIMQSTLNQASQHALEPTRIVASQNGFYKVMFKALDNRTGPSNVLEWVPKQAVSDHLVSTWRAQRAERMAFRQHRQSRVPVVRHSRADEAAFEPMDTSHAPPSQVVSTPSSSASQHPKGPATATTSFIPDFNGTHSDQSNTGTSTLPNMLDHVSAPHKPDATATDATRQPEKDMGASHHHSTSEPFSTDAQAAASIHPPAICEHAAEHVNHNTPTRENTETSRPVPEDALFEPMPQTPPEREPHQEVVESGAAQTENASGAPLPERQSLPLVQSRSGRRIQPPSTEAQSKDEQISALQLKLEMQVEEVTLLRGLYEEASQSASRDAAALKEANTTLETLKVQLKDGIEMQRQLCHAEITHRISECEKAQKQLAMVQWQLNEGQVELRRKANLWDEHVKQCEDKEKERLKQEQAAKLQNDMMHELAELAEEAQEFTPPTSLTDDNVHDKNYVADTQPSTIPAQKQLETEQNLTQQQPTEAIAHANRVTGTASRPAVRQRKTPVSSAAVTLTPFSQPELEYPTPLSASIPQTHTETETLLLQPGSSTPPQSVSQESMELSITTPTEPKAYIPGQNPSTGHIASSHFFPVNTPVSEPTSTHVQEISLTHSPPSHAEAPKPRWKRRRQSRMSSVSL